MHGRVWAPIVLAVLGCTELEEPAPITPESTILASCSALTGIGGCPDALFCSDGVCTDEMRPWCGCGDELGCIAGDCVEIDGSNRCSVERPWGACSGREVCVAGLCVPLSGANACDREQFRGLCPAGAACDGGVCVPVASRPCSAEELTGLCAPGQRCDDGECAVESCSAVAPVGACDADQICDAGRCESLPCGPLHPAGFCGPGTFCSAAGACIADATCGADADCAEDHHCVTGDVCLAVGECVTDGDCIDTQLCAIAGVCIDAGSCLDLRDCELGQLCGVLSTCLEPGACAATLDCTPGHACVAGDCEPTPVTCTTNDMTAAGCNAYELVCCPPGESCCTGRDRCSSDGSCIHHDQCLADQDCLAGYVCVDYGCEPAESCGDGCGEHERCSAVGGCIAEERCASDLDCPSDAICTPQFECRVHPGAACGGCFGSVTRAVAAFPNVAFVIDRSSEMNECNGDGSTWWMVVRDGLARAGDRYDDTIHLGLSTFPAACPDAACDSACAAGSCDNDCPPGSGVANATAGEADQPTALANSPLIQQRLAVLAPGGERALGATLRAIASATASYGLADPDRDNVIVLITSGPAGPDDDAVDGCDPGDSACKVDRAIDALAALEPAVHTQVVPLGNDGLASSEAVTVAVEAILRELLPCTFDVPGPSAGGLRVYADDGAELLSVAIDPENGWGFDEGGETFSLHGEACDRVRSGQVTPVFIGCHLCE